MAPLRGRVAASRRTGRGLRVLLVHQNFPGQYLHLVRHLAAQGGHELIFLTERAHNAIPGVRRFTRPVEHPNPALADDVQDFDLAMRRARAVQRQAEGLRGLGFVPDIILGHHGWGELLNMQDVWPDAPLLGYYEFYYGMAGSDLDFDPEFPVAPEARARVRARNMANLLALNNPGQGQTPTRFQRDTYPPWARPRLALLEEGVDLDLCRPDPVVRREPLQLGGFTVEPHETLVTYVARDLEPYRGFHVMMRALPRLHRLRPDLKVVMVGGDDVSYGARLHGTTWREALLHEVGGVIDPARLCFPGKVPYATFRALLQRSDAHVYLTYPFVLSWSLREALACGCAIVASDTEPVREFITDRRTGLLARFPDPAALADAVAELLEQPRLAARLRRAARAEAERRLGMGDYLARYEALIGAVRRDGPA